MTPTRATMSAADRILVVCHPAARPAVQEFLSVLAAEHAPSEAATVPWHIDNKYYTALVHFLVHEHVEDVVEAMRDVPAVIYAYTGEDHCIPPDSLIQSITATPPDLSFAVRIPPHTPEPDDDAAKYDPIAEEEAMDDAGLEYVDLSGLYDPVSAVDGQLTTPREALHRLRESLQTIMWPSMVRKPAPPTRHGRIRPERSPVAVGFSTSTTATATATAQQPVFPVGFSPPSSHTDLGTPLDHTTTHIPPPPPPSGPSRPSVNPFTVSPRAETTFLREEEEKLDAWLEDGSAAGVPAGDEEEGRFDDDFVVRGGGDGGRTATVSAQQNAKEEEGQDEDEFSAFQSGSHPSTHLPAAAAAAFFDKEDDDEEQHEEGEEGEDDQGLPIDPTALLHRLQSVRSELAGVSDEEERRRRAALEVQRVLQSLGLGLDDLDL